MRFDDRIATVLAWDARTPQDGARLWRQLADLLARAQDADADAVQGALARLDALESNLPLAERRRFVAGLDLGEAPASFRSHLADDPDRYGAIVPLPMVEDIVTDLWDAPEPDAPVGGHDEHHAPAHQITDLLARIDAYHARRESPSGQAFAFQIDGAGALHAQEGGALLAHCAEPPQGVDGHVAGAWRQGSAFADARLTVADGPHAGEWRISADPISSEAGRIIGYRGTARSPRVDETAVVPQVAPLSPVVGATRLDAAIVRLREPLEAIVDAVDPEALPAGEVRAAAGEVILRGAALAAAIDNLEIAVAAAGDGGLDIAALLVRIDAALQPLAVAKGLKISFRVARSLPPVSADPQAVERMVARLIGAVVALGRKREHIVARLGRDRGNGQMLALSVTRPGRLTGWPPQALLDPPAALPDADAPELGLSFALRLVDRLAQEAGGHLTIHQDRIVLALPLSADRATLRAREA